MEALGILVLVVFSIAIGVFAGYRLSGQDKRDSAAQTRAAVRNGVAGMSDDELDRMLGGDDRKPERDSS